MGPKKAEKLKEDFIRHLDEIAFFLEFNEANPFKIRAYENAGRLLKSVTAPDLAQRIEKGTLKELEGIGQSISAVAESFAKSGKSSEWNEAKGELPDSLLEMREIHGLGFRRVKKIYEELNVKSLQDLEVACEHDKLTVLPSFGQNAQDKILEQIEKIKRKK